MDRQRDEYSERCLTNLAQCGLKSGTQGVVLRGVSRGLGARVLTTPCAAFRRPGSDPPPPCETRGIRAKMEIAAKPEEEIEEEDTDGADCERLGTRDPRKVRARILSLFRLRLQWSWRLRVLVLASWARGLQGAS